MEAAEILPTTKEVKALRLVIQALESAARRIVILEMISGKRMKFSHIVRACEPHFKDAPMNHPYSELGVHIRNLKKVGLLIRYPSAMNGKKGAYYALDTDKIKLINLFITQIK